MRPLLAAGAPDLTAQGNFGGRRYQLDTIPVPRIVEEWRTHARRHHAIHRIVESMLRRARDAPDPRTDELFDALLPLLREDDLYLSLMTASKLGRAEGEVGGRWTTVLLDLPRQLLEE